MSRDQLSPEEQALIAPSHALYMAMMRVQEEYFDACEDLNYNPYDRPLELFFLILGRVTSATAEAIIADADPNAPIPSREEMIGHFMATIDEGSKLKGGYTAGQTLQ